MSKEINMDIEVGDYVRTRSGIGKVEQIGNSLFWLEDGSSYSLSDKTIKHGKKIIDLIEVGDFVNGNIVTDKYLFAGEMPVVETSGVETNAKCLCEKDIQLILTHEQYSQNCYTVERR